MSTYAKIRKQQSLDQRGKRIIVYTAEIRKIEHLAPIVSEMLDGQFESRNELQKILKEQGYKIVNTWGEAESSEGIYRDGLQGIYKYKYMRMLTVDDPEYLEKNPEYVAQMAKLNEEFRDPDFHIKERQKENKPPNNPTIELFDPNLALD